MYIHDVPRSRHLRHRAQIVVHATTVDSRRHFAAPCFFISTSRSSVVPATCTRNTLRFSLRTGRFSLRAFPDFIEAQAGDRIALEFGPRYYMNAYIHLSPHELSCLSGEVTQGVLWARVCHYDVIQYARDTRCSSLCASTNIASSCVTWLHDAPCVHMIRRVLA